MVKTAKVFPNKYKQPRSSKPGGRGCHMIQRLLHIRALEPPFTPPPWAIDFTAPERRHWVENRGIDPTRSNFWWIEVGGADDTIGNAEKHRDELLPIAYGVWDYMKNHPDGRAKGYDLDWIGALPGKRESARFIGPHVLTQHDVMSGGHFEDVVAYGGWTLDDHHPDAFWKHGHLSEHHVCPSPFGIPFDCLYSVNVPNLMFAGRDISGELAACVDTVSISLNHPDPGQYQRLVRSRYGDEAFPAMLAFAKHCAEKGIQVVMTTVDTTITHEEEARCREICEATGARYRIRPWEG